jgi:hypothetical protein
MSNRQQEIFANVSYDRSKLAVSNGQALGEIIFHQSQFPESRSEVAYFVFDTTQPGIIAGNTYEVFPVLTEGELSPYVNQSTTSPLDLRNVSSPNKYTTAEVLTDAHRLGVKGSHPTQTGQADLVISHTRTNTVRICGTTTQPITLAPSTLAPNFTPFGVSGYMVPPIAQFNAVPLRASQGGYSFIVQFTPTATDITNRTKVTFAVRGINSSANAPQ